MKASHFNNIAVFDRLPSLSPSFEESNLPGFTTLSITTLLTVVFILGVFILLLRLLIQLISLWKMHSKAILLQDGKIKIYHISEPIIPFSYFNNIYLNKDNYNEQELNEIVNHELAHVQQKHAIDILITEIICIINWYNPIVWLLKKAIKENLEFIADDIVIRKGIDKKCYQYLLLKVTGNVSFSLANNLNFSSLKGRICMMNKTKTGAFHLVKFFMFIPLAIALLLAFRNRQEVFTAKTMEQGTPAKTYFLAYLTYGIPDKKVAMVVKKEQDKSLFKTGRAMNLDVDLFLSERDRLRNLLQKNGYNVEKTGGNNSGKYGIIFMVDTTLGNNNLSVQVNISLAKDQLIQGKETSSGGKQISLHDGSVQKSANIAKRMAQGYAASSSDKDDDKVMLGNTSVKGNLFGIK